jgi:acetyl-CoA hydrolase/transferase-like protein
LEDGRSILMIRSTKKENGKVQSNIRWNYAHTTIPRHLKDIVVTEYGIADLRGRTDEEVIAALIEVADSDFQDELTHEAIRAGKLSRNYRIPDLARNNRHEHLKEVLAPYLKQGLFQPFPFGTDLTQEEITLRKALLALKNQQKKFHIPGLTVLRKTAAIPEAALPYLERMELSRPKSIKEKLMQRAVVYGLASVNAI